MEESREEDLEELEDLKGGGRGEDKQSVEVDGPETEKELQSFSS